MGLWTPGQGLQGVVNETPEQKDERLRRNQTKYTNTQGKPISFTPSAQDGRGGGPQSTAINEGPKAITQGSASTQQDSTMPLTNVNTGRLQMATPQQLAMQRAMGQLGGQAQGFTSGITGRDPLAMSGVGDKIREGELDTDIYKGINILGDEKSQKAVNKLLEGSDYKGALALMQKNMKNSLATTTSEKIQTYIDTAAEDAEALKQLQGIYKEAEKPSVYGRDTSDIDAMERQAMSRQLANERSTGSLGALSEATGALKDLREATSGYESGIDPLSKQYEVEKGEAGNIGTNLMKSYIDSYFKEGFTKQDYNQLQDTISRMNADPAYMNDYFNQKHRVYGSMEGIIAARDKAKLAWETAKKLKSGYSTTDLYGIKPLAEEDYYTPLVY